MNRLRKLLTGVLLSMAAATTQAQDYAYLTITESGNDTSYEVSKITKITFTSDYMVLHLQSGTTEQLPLASLQKMSFALDASGIQGLSVSPSQIRLSEGTLHVTVDKPSHLIIYNAGGGQVKSIPVGAGETEVSLTGMQKGVYIVKVGDQTQKVMNK